MLTSTRSTPNGSVTSSARHRDRAPRGRPRRRSLTAARLGGRPCARRRAGVAPSASRTPNSRVRAATPPDTTPYTPAAAISMATTAKPASARREEPRRRSPHADLLCIVRIGPSGSSGSARAGGAFERARRNPASASVERPAGAVAAGTAAPRCTGAARTRGRPGCDARRRPPRRQSATHSRAVPLADANADARPPAR